jgi:CubicO group peptidase (beta-lactamase class C family)
MRTVVALALLQAALFASTLLAQGLPRARPEAVGMSSQRLARLAPVLRGYVERGEIAGVVTVVARNGKVVAIDSAGFADLETRTPIRSTTIFRIASMTKPVTSVAVMMLVEDGRLLLSEPVSKYLPAFRNMRIASVAAGDSGRAGAVSYGPARRPITVRDLLTHRSGISYGFIDAGPVGDAYRQAGVTDGISGVDITLSENVERLAAQPLTFEPGTKFGYGLSIDVLGRLIEVVSGQPLDVFFRERIFQPLGMRDTWFYVPDSELARLAVPYTQRNDGGLRAMAATEQFGNMRMGGKEWRGSRTFFSGGAGLFSTAGDYARFCQMLLNGGELNGARLLAPKTVELMTVSHTNDLGRDLAGPGTGVGLGFAIVDDLGRTGSYGSVGRYAWGGAYGSTFWVDPKEELVGVMMIQLFPQTGVRVSETFQTLAYQAIVGSPRGANGGGTTARR